MNLPQELVEEIIDHLSGDTTALKATSLVCHAWMPRSRSHLFGTCTLGPKNILAFHDLLRDPRGCTFLDHVRAITAFRYSWADNDGCFNTIAADLRRLTSVRSLAMKLNIVVDQANADAFFRTGFVTGFPNVTELVLTCNLDGDDAATAPVVDMVCMLPALECLVVREMSDAATRPPTAPACPPPGLRSLRLSPYAVGPVLAWLHAAKHLPHVESLALPLLLRRDAPVVRAALQQLGSAVLHLEFVLTWVLDYSDVDPLTVFDLSLHPSLRTLALTDRSWADPEEFDDRHLIPFVSRLAAPGLTHVSFDLDLALYRALNWAPLDALFASSARFPALRSVAFVRSPPHDEPFLRRALPLLNASGILKVVS
ncbi:hypothetical protein C8R44DRAFT_991042 [Mycena epipterygia]|nr:hypothetical protein C8R44DRAFT_991042 [Mycena epipterygia]